ncbi:hypothetical protein K6119_13645 [Paracrocinitomix mangrovi]|uniref:hypothetical protein n=1 Tax=Paracrocinitomix mangrovi TaxID=2862509 RepID=UPI001C8D498F|nr:hypothetical protein [Paracrocinitomix mangrovi]UKN00774.1 hypothetical protein K6119_13645 [Paracrocinitomix mangrovi]
MRRRILLLSLLILSSISTFAQELSPERKYYNLQVAENKLAQLPYEIDFFRDSVLTEVHGERRVLAPHYPDITSIDRTKEARTNAFTSWITMYKSEYDAYYSYLVNYVRTHQ